MVGFRMGTGSSRGIKGVCSSRMSRWKPSACVTGRGVPKNESYAPTASPVYITARTFYCMELGLRDTIIHYTACTRSKLDSLRGLL